MKSIPYSIIDTIATQQILLEAPDDIFCFKFNPSDPNVITGGCINGQVVMWDISKHSDRLRSNQQGKRTKKNTMSSLVKYCMFILLIIDTFHNAQFSFNVYCIHFYTKSLTIL